MAIHLIVDGYNLIRNSPELDPIDQQDLQAGREALIDMLAAYKRIKPHRITVVFDGTQAPGFYPHRDRAKGIQIVFSQAGQAADAVIIHMVRRERERAMVVSSDREILHAAETHHASAIRSEAFAQKLALVGDTSIGFDTEESTGWVPTTQKKGPKRRLRKKQRRNKHKTEKL